MESIFQELASNWPSPWVARTEIKNFTGGMLSERYAANLDCSGRGIAGRVRVGRKICYPVKEVIRFLEARSEVVPERTRHPE